MQPGDATTDWYLIGPGEWVEGRKVARVTINTTPPEGSNTSRWIEVDLAEQTLMVYDNYQLVFATVVATGLEPFWTRPGLFQIQVKKETETMRNSDPSDFYYLENVPWTMYFDGARAREQGFVGICRFTAKSSRIAPAHRKILSALASYSYYAGTGRKTTMGMGLTRRL